MNVAEAIERAPGCFGVSITYTPTSPVCQGCDFADECAPEAENMMQEIAETLSVDDLVGIMKKASKREVGELNVSSAADKRKVLAGVMNKPKASQLTEQQELMLETIRSRYSKGERLMKWLFKQGIDLKGELAKGCNPCVETSSHAWMEFACDVVLEGSFGREKLRDRLVERMGWKTSTANAHCLTFLHTLGVLEVLRESDAGIFELNV